MNKEKNNKWICRRVLSLVLILVLSLVMLPEMKMAVKAAGNEAAIDNTEYATFDAAVNAWNSTGGSTIKLLQNVTLTKNEQLNKGDNLKLDLNGKTITCKNYAISYTGSGYFRNLTITGAGTIVGSGTVIKIEGDAGLKVIDATISGNEAINYNSSGGTFDINGGAIIIGTTTAINTNNKKLNIHGGKIVGNILGKPSSDPVYGVHATGGYYTKDPEAYKVNGYVKESYVGQSDWKYTDCPYRIVIPIDAEVTTPPTAQKLTYNGSAQELVTAGEPKAGVMKYALGTNATTEPTTGWDTKIPTGTDVGSYYVWYKAFSTQGKNDSDAGCVTATIEQGDEKGEEKKADDTNNPLFLSGLRITQSKGKMTVKWKKAEGASKYAVYASYCGTTLPKKPIKTTTSDKISIKKLGGKPIDFSRTFKFYVVAYDSSGKEIGKTVVAHIVGKNNKKYSNPKSIKLSAKSITVAKGQSSKIKASVKLENSKRKALSTGHAARLRFASSNVSIATVDKSGKVTGVGPGTCTVYVYAQNGLAKKVAVTVN